MYTKFTRAALLTVLMLGGFVVGAVAQEGSTPEKRELIRELLELTGSTKNVNAVTDAIIAQQEKDLPKLLERSSSLTDSMTREERLELDHQIRESTLRALRRMKEVLKEMNFAQLVSDLAVPVYGKHFSESELREWIAFYKTALGKKSIELMPVLMTEMMTTVSDSLLPKIQVEMDKIIADETKQLAQHSKSVSPPRVTPKPRTRRRH